MIEDNVALIAGEHSRHLTAAKVDAGSGFGSRLVGRLPGMRRDSRLVQSI